ncbi:hypothetical protein NDU88_002115 [Pleurodeles waltl]|uniref:Uncharacterized protein n=1 Tax=Pleurodeles waltl TaxID=8319 RepID=A0AAV7Q8Y9_PLEWA|nr:hypothetical protein NDU88_002115 [Pleurodeles waltl]
MDNTVDNVDKPIIPTVGAENGTCSTSCGSYNKEGEDVERGSEVEELDGKEAEELGIRGWTFARDGWVNTCFLYKRHVNKKIESTVCVPLYFVLKEGATRQ